MFWTLEGGKERLIAEEKKSVMIHPKAVPDPEVPEKTARRRFTAASKLRILKEAEDKLIEERQAVREGKQPEVKRIPTYTFKQLADQYKAWIEGRQSSAKVKGYVIGQLGTHFGTLKPPCYGGSRPHDSQGAIGSQGHKDDPSVRPPPTVP